MGRYLLFQFNKYYPRGGWGDFVDSFDELEIAIRQIRERDEDCAQIIDQIIDTKHGEEVYFRCL